LTTDGSKISDNYPVPPLLLSTYSITIILYIYLLVEACPDETHSDLASLVSTAMYVNDADNPARSACKVIAVGTPVCCPPSKGLVTTVRPALPKPVIASQVAMAPKID
jgi:hypothetical protein